jgi:Protein of unknown function (DUF2511)
MMGLSDHSDGGSSAGDGNSGGNSVEVSRTDFRGDWPLTVESGVLACESAGAVTFTANGTTYAVNGIAESQDAGADIDPIWTDTGAGLKKNIGPLIDRGLELCDST